jgi:IS5 family transposase
MPAVRYGPRSLKRVTVDTTVQPKAITFPTDAKLLHAAIKGLNRLASKHGVQLRQSYLRIAKRAAMMAGRYAHAKQFNRHRRELRILRTRLGRIIRDIRRRITSKAELEAAFDWRCLAPHKSARSNSASVAEAVFVPCP